MEGNSNLPHAQADLSATKTDSQDPAQTGRNLTYTVTVANAGPDAADAAVVTDTLPSGVEFVSATPTVGSCNEAAGVVTCALGGLAPGALESIEVVVVPRSAGFIQNTASVAASTGDPIGFNNQASEETRICRATSRRSSIPCG
jgi:uncharacterized repeat protein (TIGR01451 family)